VRSIRGPDLKNLDGGGAVVFGQPRNATWKYWWRNNKQDEDLEESGMYTPGLVYFLVCTLPEFNALAYDNKLPLHVGNLEELSEGRQIQHGPRLFGQ
jgi:hypothetical protein